MKISISVPYLCTSPRDVIYYLEIPSHIGKCLLDLKFCKNAGYFDKMCINGCAEEQVDSSPCRAVVDHYFITQKEVPHLEKCTPKSQILSKEHDKQTVDFGG